MDPERFDDDDSDTDTDSCIDTTEPPPLVDLTTTDSSKDCSTTSQDKVLDFKSECYLSLQNDLDDAVKRLEEEGQGRPAIEILIDKIKRGLNLGLAKKIKKLEKMQRSSKSPVIKFLSRKLDLELLITMAAGFVEKERKVRNSPFLICGIRSIQMDLINLILRDGDLVELLAGKKRKTVYLKKAKRVETRLNKESQTTMTTLTELINKEDDRIQHSAERLVQLRNSTVGPIRTRKRGLTSTSLQRCTTTTSSSYAHESHIWPYPTSRLPPSETITENLLASSALQPNSGVTEVDTQLLHHDNISDVSYRGLADDDHEEQSFNKDNENNVNPVNMNPYPSHDVQGLNAAYTRPSHGRRYASLSLFESVQAQMMPAEGPMRPHHTGHIIRPHHQASMHSLYAQSQYTLPTGHSPPIPFDQNVWEAHISQTQSDGSYMQPGGSYMQPGDSYMQSGVRYMQPGGSYMHPGGSYMPPYEESYMQTLSTYNSPRSGRYLGDRDHIPTLYRATSMRWESTAQYTPPLASWSVPPPLPPPRNSSPE